MAHSRTKRIATAALTAAAVVVGGGIAMAAPASAVTRGTDCPAPPTWSAGIELWVKGGANHYCFEDDGIGGFAPAYVNYSNVQDATSGWNYADIYVLGHNGPLPIAPNQSLHLSTSGVTVTEVYIHP